MITLKTTTDKHRNETTVSAYDDQNGFVCNATSAGIGTRITLQLSQQVKLDAERIQRAEQARPRYHLADVPAMRVQALAFPSYGA